MAAGSIQSTAAVVFKPASVAWYELLGIMPWLRLRADQRASHCRRASRSTSIGSGLVSMSTGPPGSTSETSLRHAAGTDRGLRLEEEVDRQHPAQVGLTFHGPWAPAIANGASIETAASPADNSKR